MAVTTRPIGKDLPDTRGRIFLFDLAKQQIVREMLWQGETLYLYNGGRVYARLFANVVRIADLFAVPAVR